MPPEPQATGDEDAAVIPTSSLSSPSVAESKEVHESKDELAGKADDHSKPGSEVDDSGSSPNLSPDTPNKHHEERTSPTTTTHTTPKLQRTRSAPGTPGRAGALTPSTTSTTYHAEMMMKGANGRRDESYFTSTSTSWSSARPASPESTPVTPTTSAEQDQDVVKEEDGRSLSTKRSTESGSGSGSGSGFGVSGTSGPSSGAGEGSGGGSSSRSGSGSGSGLEPGMVTPRSRKGKEKAVEPISSPGLDAALSRGLGLHGEVDGTDVGVSGEMVMGGQHGDAAKGLRELVRRSTGIGSGTGTGSGAGNGSDIGYGTGIGGGRPRSVRTESVRSVEARSRAVSLRGGMAELEVDQPPDPGRTYTPRRYYVLTLAGKPVFTSHNDETEDVTNLMAVAQAIISIFAEDDDRLRCIVKGRFRIAFVLKAPLYLFCVSDWGEPEHVLRQHLEYIHLQILSVVSGTQLSRALQRRSNFDVSRLLEGTESFLHNLIARCQHDFTFLTSTLQPLRLAPALRDTAAAALMPPAKFKDLLYVLLVAGKHIVTLLRPRKHSIHPSDLHLLLNTIESSATLRSGETWLPICLPKFNASGFVHAYISFIMDEVGLVFVSADKEAFEELRGWKESVVEKLEKDKTLGKIQQAIPDHLYSASALGCPGLRHFIYKSRQLVQLTSPAWEKPYNDETSRYRLLTLYHKLHDAVHARSGQSSPLKLIYAKTDHEACLAWITMPFELYIAVSPQLSKSAVVAIANSVARWVTAEEGKIFLKDAPVF